MFAQIIMESVVSFLIFPQPVFYFGSLAIGGTGACSFIPFAALSFTFAMVSGNVFSLAQYP